MKYNININQLILADTSLDIIDSAIIDYLYFYCNSINEKIENHRIRDETGVWTWVNYGTILEDMPLLRIKSTASLTPRIKKIEDAGFISTKRVDNQKLFIKLNSSIDELFIKTNRAVRETKQSYSVTRTNNNTIDNTTTIREREPTPKEQAEDFFNNPEKQEQLIEAMVSKGLDSPLVKKELRKFIDYWCELTRDGRKQRWELEKTFQVKQRLVTWFNKINEFHSKREAPRVVKI